MCEKILVTMVRQWGYGYLDVLNLNFVEIYTDIYHAKTL